ncbi:MAG: hypothetical protein LBC78_05270 [Oscillospiraceae bacterium]|nr:hypothetical protein [Oscillospiraceae bacterium]
MGLLNELSQLTGRAPEDVKIALAALLNDAPEAVGLGKAESEFRAAVAEGITDGTRPNAPATRAQVAVMARRAAGRR